MDFYIFGVFQLVAIILFDAQNVPSLASGSPWKGVSVTF